MLQVRKQFTLQKDKLLAEAASASVLTSYNLAPNGSGTESEDAEYKLLVYQPENSARVKLQPTW